MSKFLWLVWFFGVVEVVASLGRADGLSFLKVLRPLLVGMRCVVILPTIRTRPCPN